MRTKQNVNPVNFMTSGRVWEASKQACRTGFRAQVEAGVGWATPAQPGTNNLLSTACSLPRARRNFASRTERRFRQRQAQSELRALAFGGFKVD